jgi:hypothetical protein
MNPTNKRRFDSMNPFRISGLLNCQGTTDFNAGTKAPKMTSPQCTTNAPWQAKLPFAGFLKNLSF